MLADFANSTRTNCVSAMKPVEQPMARAQAGQPSRQAANVLLHHCECTIAAHLQHLLQPVVTNDLANTNMIRKFARSMHFTDNELCIHNDKTSLPLAWA